MQINEFEHQNLVLLHFMGAILASSVASYNKLAAGKS